MISYWRTLASRALRLVFGLGLIGLLLVAFGRDLYHFPRSAGWPVTRGEVIQSEFIRDDSFSVDFAYRYAVDGTTYTGDKITFFGYAVFANGYQNEQFIKNHPVGSAVDVHYDPGDPARSVLMRMIPLSQMWSPLLLFLCLASTLVTAATGFLIRRFVRDLRQRSRAYGEYLQH